MTGFEAASTACRNAEALRSLVKGMETAHGVRAE